MFTVGIRHVLAAFTLLSICGAGSLAAAEDMSKEACLEAHGRGQDAREQGKLSLARTLFVSCAQAGCPALVQSDCARLADELQRFQPWLSFAARDSQGNDLPDAIVYVDDVLVATRLADGRPYDVDPGKHVVRFLHGGRERVVTIVVGSGEKGRTVLGTFETTTSASSEPQRPERARDAPARKTHARGARTLIATSVAVIAGGAALGIVGLTRLPSNCTLSKHECAAPPGDVSFEDAAKAVKLANAGWGLAGVGAAGLTVGLIWFLKSGKVESEGRNGQVTVWALPEGAGLSLRGRM
jgi:hypothetical protein